MQDQNVCKMRCFLGLFHCFIFISITRISRCLTILWIGEHFFISYSLDLGLLHVLKKTVCILMLPRGSPSQAQGAHLE